MKPDKIQNKGQARLFENPALEALTKTHPLVIWGMYIPIHAFILYYAAVHLDFSAGKIIGWFLSGMAFWSLFEYFAHRYLFHMEPSNEMGKRIAYIMHGNHHEYPRDRQRLFMPPVPSLILAGIIFSVQYLILGNLSFAFFPGFMIGYLLYGTMHYAIHAMKPPFKWMKPLWRNHHLHHYKDEEKGFGVSSTIWDHVFGTMFDLRREKEDDEKVKNLMFDDQRAKERATTPH